MLQEDFYIITEHSSTDNSVEAVIEINPSHQIFEGHFPQQPVVPGVCMMQIIKEFTEAALSKKFRLKKADNIKFLSVINPIVNNVVHVALKYSITENGIVTVNASLSKDEITYLKFKGHYNEV